MVWSRPSEYSVIGPHNILAAGNDLYSPSTALPSYKSKLQSATCGFVKGKGNMMNRIGGQAVGLVGYYRYSHAGGGARPSS